MNSSTTDYSTIALRVAGFLKEGGRPYSTKELYEQLFPEGVPISYANFSHNILQKMHSDTRVNVERAWRGFWQYRWKK